MNTAISISESASKIDAICATASELFASPDTFTKELSVAQAVVDLRAALTDEVMQPIMALMNTSLGFKTDQDPKRPSANNPNPKPYSIEVVREVFIESKLRGFHTVGNEFNIISGNFYGCVNGFERKVKKHSGVTDFKDFYEVPRMSGDKGALVKCKAEWRQNGTAQTLEREFAIRVNAGMGADGITGKAKRKLLAAVFGRLTGIVTPEGDASDAVVDVKSTVEAQPASALFPKAKEATAKPEADNVPMDGKTPLADNPAAPESPREKLSRLCTESGVSFQDFRDFVHSKNIAKNADSWPSFEAVPVTVCEALEASPKTMAELFRKFGNLQKK